LYAIHHTILVITISYKGQPAPSPLIKLLTRRTVQEEGEEYEEERYEERYEKEEEERRAGGAARGRRRYADDTDPGETLLD